jgi:hypothetical protein
MELEEYLLEAGERGIVIVPFDTADLFRVTPGDVLRAVKELGWTEVRVGGKIGWTSCKTMTG